MWHVLKYLQENIVLGNKHESFRMLMPYKYMNIGRLRVRRMWWEKCVMLCYCDPGPLLLLYLLCCLWFFSTEIFSLSLTLDFCWFGYSRVSRYVFWMVELMVSIFFLPLSIRMYLLFEVHDWIDWHMSFFMCVLGFIKLYKPKLKIHQVNTTQFSILKLTHNRTTLPLPLTYSRLVEYEK